MCLSNRPEHFLDIGCGTGDLTVEVANRSNENLVQIGLDYSKPMLDRAKVKTRIFFSNRIIDFVEGNAAELPFGSGVFDSVGIAFAFRNLTYKNPLAKLHLKEVYRVLSSKGRYVIVESSQPDAKFIRTLDHLYLKYFVFWLGYLISGNKGAYRYLSQSAANFYDNT